MEDKIQIFKALSDETRLKILIILSKKKICAKGIANHLDISEAAVSQHIKILKESGIIKGEKVGYYVHYNIENQCLKQASDFIKSLVDKDLDYGNLGVHLPNKCRVLCRENGDKCCKYKNKI